MLISEEQARRWRLRPGADRALVQAPGDVRWYALRTKPQREGAARAWLNRNGAAAFYPAEAAWRRCGRSRVAYERRLAPGYVFAGFEGEPRWGRLFDEAPGALYLTGVLGSAGRPVAIPEARLDAIRSLACVAQSLAEAAAARAAEAARVSPGDRVEIVAGPLSGWVVEVEAILDRSARVRLPLLGQGTVSAPLASLRRVA